MRVLQRLIGIARHASAERHPRGVDLARLAALGEPFVADAHHPYRPDLDDGFEVLRRAFAETRTVTLALVDQQREARRRLRD